MSEGPKPLRIRPRWYLVRTHGQQERLALHSLEQRGFNGRDDGIGEAYLPLFEKADPRPARRGELIAAPFFPCYLFVLMTVDPGRPTGWQRVFSTRGVKSVFCGGAGGLGPPTPIPDAAIERVKAQEIGGMVALGLAAKGEQEQALDRAFVPGQTVTLKKGPWAEFTGIFHERIDSRRCAVMLRLFGDSQFIAEAALAHIE